MITSRSTTRAAAQPLHTKESEISAAARGAARAGLFIFTSPATVSFHRTMLPKFPLWQTIIFLTLLVAGCARYKALPLSSSAVEQGLAAPNLNQLRVSAQSIKHPLLKPIAFDNNDGLTPDQAAILAVLANPSLRA